MDKVFAVGLGFNKNNHIIYEKVFTLSVHVIYEGVFIRTNQNGWLFRDFLSIIASEFGYKGNNKIINLNDVNFLELARVFENEKHKEIASFLRKASYIKNHTAFICVISTDKLPTNMTESYLMELQQFICINRGVISSINEK